jgi:hypothetical protein
MLNPSLTMILLREVHQVHVFVRELLSPACVIADVMPVIEQDTCSEQSEPHDARECSGNTCYTIWQLDSE